MKRIAVLLVLLLAARLAGAQQGLVVESFRLDPFDATAATTEHQVLDYNQNPCALVKVMIIDNTVNFKSDWIIRTDSRGKNEYWVYLCEGTRSLTVRSDYFLPTEVVFADYDPEIKGLKKKNTYVLTLSYAGEIEDGRVGVTFACNTPMAEYLIDGYATERNTNTFRIEPGEHTVEVKADGYQKLTTTVKVSPYLKRQEIALTLTPDQSIDSLMAEGDRYYGEKNYTKALDLYRQVAAKGNVTAMKYIGYAYLYGEGVEKDYAQAFKWYSQGADRGDAGCQLKMGYIYLEGLGVQKDYTEAVKWYRLAADQGRPSAQNEMGNMYYNGQGVSQDYMQAFEWYSKAAGQGDYYAQTNLGVMYGNGVGVSQDYTKAFEWFSKAANQGFAPAQNFLGVIYENGIGVRQDYSQAFEWYTKAANQGDAEAQCNLGVMYFSKRGVKKDYQKAFEWFSKAANQGNDHAQFCLGAMYEYGWGVKKNKAEAEKWYLRAAAQGSDAAIKALERLQD